MKERGFFVIQVPRKWEVDSKDLKKEFKHSMFHVLVIERDDIDDIKFQIVK